jgi:uncharacterized protein
MKRIFLDTSGILALVNKKDILHVKAVQTNTLLLLSEIQFVITDYIFVEVGNALCKNKPLAIKTLRFLRETNDITFIKINDSFFEKALALFENFKDKEWGFTDIASFVVMKEYHILEAFTNDHHFQQFGFQTLL